MLYVNFNQLADLMVLETFIMTSLNILLLYWKCALKSLKVIRKVDAWHFVSEMTRKYNACDLGSKCDLQFTCMVAFYRTWMVFVFSSRPNKDIIVNGLTKGLTNSVYQKSSWLRMFTRRVSLMQWCHQRLNYNSMRINEKLC